MSTPSSPGTPESFSPRRALNVMVTGGSSGIGRALVEQFARAGHRVLLTYLSNVEGVRSIKEKFRNVSAVQLDQGNSVSVEQCAPAVQKWLQQADCCHLDVLINNAALGSATVQSYCGPNATSEAMDEALMRVNSMGPLWVTRAMLPFREPGMRMVIIFVGSVGGGSAAVFPEYHAADLMSKAAVAYLAKHLAAEHVHTEVDIMCISPGATETDMFRKSTLETMQDPQAFVSNMPKGQLIRPEDVAENIFFLCTSPASRMFHGAVIDASMGLAVRPGLQTEATDR